MSIFGGDPLSNWSFVGRKSPGEKVQHVIRFEDRLEENQVITGATWSAEPDGLTVTGVTSDDEFTSAMIEGGDGGTFYKVTASVDVDTGEVWERHLVVPVGDIYKEPEKLTTRRAMFMVRQFLRDRPDDNELDFGELQSSWDDLRRSVQSALSDWNTTTPPTDYDLKQFPTKARRLLYQKAAVETLRSAAQSEGRNQYQYSDQGFSAQEHSHGPMFMQFAQSLNKEYERKKKKLKLSINAQSFWGGSSVDSAYSDHSPFDGRPGY
jgi:hypothetical protein